MIERPMTWASIDRGSGPPVLLLHGQPGSGSAWLSLVGLLEPQFRVLAPDRVGYGATPGEAVGLAENAELAARFLSDLGVGPTTVVAHSWAGGVAVLLADRYPQLVSSLVLVGAACTPDSLTTLDFWLNLPVIGDALTAVGLFSISEVLPVLRLMTGSVPQSLGEWLRAALPDYGVMGNARGATGRPKRSFMVEQRALTEEMASITDTLGSLDLPTEVVAGDWDVVVPPAAAVTLARAIPEAELTLVPRAGHFLARDAPEQLAAVIERAVSRVGETGRSAS
jgi:pimeloyl-ACP methyl ester carboxylesterase